MKEAPLYVMVAVTAIGSLLIASCGDDDSAPDAAGTRDAGPRDSAVQVDSAVDGGMGSDAGSGTDAATSMDGGGDLDAGTATDAGRACTGICPAGELCVAGRCAASCEPSCGPIRQLVASQGNTCALAFTGELWCWGNNDYGQVGVGSDSERFDTPQRVTSIDDAISVGVGGGHACAARADGTVWCWGSNETGQLGQAATVTGSRAPMRVPGISDAVEVATGGVFTFPGDPMFAHDAGGHSCARVSDGTVWCWGSNRMVQIANIDLPDVVFAATPIPTVRARRILASADRACALTADERAWCWGGTDKTLAPTTTDGLLLYDMDYAGVRDMDVSTTLQMYLLSDERVVYDGVDLAGETTEPQFLADNVRNLVLQVTFGIMGTTPLVEGQSIGSLTGPSLNRLAAGQNHGCRVTTEGSVLCWGFGLRGQLGNGIIALQREPAAVGGLTDVETIAAGDLHTCVASGAGTIRCWGSNQHGQLGDGSVETRSVPVAITLP